jgi:hypothetical protein
VHVRVRTEEEKRIPLPTTTVAYIPKRDRL